MHGACATVLRPRRVMMIALRICVGKMSLAHEMRRVLEELPDSWQECPQKQSGDSNG